MIAATEQLETIDLLTLVRDAQSGNQEAMEQVIARCTRRVYSVAVNLHSQAMDVEDLVQEGLIGVVAAVNSYNTDKGATFTTYATFKARCYMLDAVRRYGGIIRVPRVAIKQGAQRNLKYAPLSRGNGEDAEPGYVLPDTLPDEAKQLDDFRYMTRGLADRTRYILEQYFVCDRTMKDIASDLDMSESRISQLMSRAMQSLRERV